MRDFIGHCTPGIFRRQIYISSFPTGCLQFARQRGEMSKLATVKRAELSAKAELSRGGDFVPLGWMQTPLMFENQAAGKAASMGTLCLLPSHDNIHGTCAPYVD